MTSNISRMCLWYIDILIQKREKQVNKMQVSSDVTPAIVIVNIQRKVIYSVCLFKALFQSDMVFSLIVSHFYVDNYVIQKKKSYICFLLFHQCILFLLLHLLLSLSFFYSLKNVVTILSLQAIPWSRAVVYQPLLQIELFKQDSPPPVYSLSYFYS